MPPLPRSLGHRAPLLWLAAPYAAGLAAGRWGGFDLGWGNLTVALAAAIAALCCSERWPRAWGATLAIAMLFAGMATYARERARLPDWENLPPREARLSLRIDRVFPQGDFSRVAGLGTVVHAEEHLRDLVGQRFYFSLNPQKNEPTPVRSAVVSALGVMVTLPRNPPADTFDGYLASAGINFRFTRGRILTEEKAPLPYYRFCARAAGRFKEILGEGIAQKRPALAGLLRAMMLGETHELSDEQRTLFMQSGTMHLFAISGLNIAAVAGGIQALLLLLRLPRGARFALGTAALWLFVDITGGSPSAVRAFVMAAFLQGAFVLRQPGNLLAALVASAFAVLLFAPLQIFGASFLMSYGIVAALLVLGLPLGEAWLARWTPWRDLPEITWSWWHRWTSIGWHWTVTAIAVGLATTLVSLLTSVQFFRLLTPGALLANLLLIPAAMAATLGGFCALLCGLVGFAWGASFCNHGAALMLLGIEWLVAQSVKVPGAFLRAHFSAPWIGLAALATLMAALLAGYAGNWQKARGGWWPPFAIVALALLAGVTFD